MERECEQLNIGNATIINIGIASGGQNYDVEGLSFKMEGRRRGTMNSHSKLLQIHYLRSIVRLVHLQKKQTTHVRIKFKPFDYSRQGSMEISQWRKQLNFQVT